MWDTTHKDTNATFNADKKKSLNFENQVLL